MRCMFMMQTARCMLCDKVLHSTLHGASCVRYVAASGTATKDDKALIYSALIFLTISLYCGPLLVVAVLQTYTRYI